MDTIDAVQLRQSYDVLRAEFQVMKQKLDSKCEALLIISKDLDQCRQERDQFKLMAEQVQARYQSIKRQLAGVGPRQTPLDGVEYSDMKHQSLAQLLCEMRDVNKSLQFEVDDLKQKLKDANGDIKLLREQIVRQRVGATDEGMDTRHFPAHEREDLVCQLEAANDKINQMERDLQQVLDEKEELVTERDVYRVKHERLNKELNYILKGDEKRVLDIDALIMENRYLQERIHQVEDEKAMALATITKYKGILDKKKNKGILKLGQVRSGGMVISHKQVHELLQNGACLTTTPQMMADLQSLASALLESLNDKNVALSHQRKTNRILGERVAELEKKLKSLEVSGLWNLAEKSETVGGETKLHVESNSGRVTTGVTEGVTCHATNGSHAADLPLSLSDTDSLRGDEGQRETRGRLLTDDLDLSSLTCSEQTAEDQDEEYSVRESPATFSPRLNDSVSDKEIFQSSPLRDDASLPITPEHPYRQGSTLNDDDDVTAMWDLVSTATQRFSELTQLRHQERSSADDNLPGVTGVLQKNRFSDDGDDDDDDDVDIKTPFQSSYLSADGGILNSERNTDCDLMSHAAAAAFNSSEKSRLINSKSTCESGANKSKSELQLSRGNNEAINRSETSHSQTTVDDYRPRNNEVNEMGC